jgi:hypothetical protein
MPTKLRIFSAITGIAWLLAQPGIEPAHAQLGRGATDNSVAPPIVRPMSRVDRAVLRVDRATAVEERLGQAIEEIVSIDFHNTQLDDAIAQLSTRYGVPMQLDNKGLADAAVDQKAPVTRSVRGVSLRGALDLILEEFDLTWVIQDEVVKITSKEKADEILTTKIYPVSDLIGVGHNWGPLMNLITNTIQPDSWDDNGGPGSIQPFAVGDLLVISQKQDVHEEIAVLLVMIRRETGTAPRPTPLRLRHVSSTVHQSGTARPSYRNLSSATDHRRGPIERRATTPDDSDTAYTTNASGLQVVSGLYGATCRVRTEIELQSPQ